MTQNITLGKGKFSEVYLSEHNGEPCAIKFADNAGNSRRYIRHEVEILEALNDCKNTVRMLDYKISRKGYIKYELLDKQLLDIIDELSLQDIEIIAAQLEYALKEIHDRGVIHCDLKPENIMFSGNTLKLIDFGCSLFVDEVFDVSHKIGTLYYRSPENVIGAPIDYRIDYWAAGCIIAELLIGTPLFDPRRDNKMFVHSSLIGMMSLVFGEFNSNFLSKGRYSYRYFDVTKKGNVYKFRYLLSQPTALSQVLIHCGISRVDALHWANRLHELFSYGDLQRFVEN